MERKKLYVILVDQDSIMQNVYMHISLDIYEDLFAIIVKKDLEVNQIFNDT